MQIADARIRLNKLGSDVPVKGVTPAEAVLLHILHQGNNGGNTFGEEMDKIKILGDARGADGQAMRTDAEEMRRLMAKYGRCVNKKGTRIIKLIWPELSPKLPKTFAELKWSDIQYDGEDIAALDIASGSPINGGPALSTPPPAVTK